MGPRADRPERRRFTAEYKAQILAEYEAADRGVRGSVLRREGLYSSHIIEWHKAAEAGAAAGLAPQPGGVSGTARSSSCGRVRRAEAELAKHKAALDLMGKAHALLETLSQSADPVAAKRSKR